MKKLIYLLPVLLIIMSACNKQQTKIGKAIILTENNHSDTITTEDLSLLKKIAILRTESVKAGKKQMENISLENQNKSVGIINELLNRAEQKILNALPAGRYVWSWDGYDEPDGMIDMAEGFLKTLSEGTDPFEGKYAEPGGYVVDHAIIKKDGLWHLIYIRGTVATNWPEYPLSNFGHATSSDLKNWHTEKPVLETSPSLFDSYQVWAPHIIKHQEKYWMFYAGVNDSTTQGICLATSDDLYHWKRSEKNPLITSFSWGVWDSLKWSDCRDPMILKDGDSFYCYYTAAQINPDNGKQENCLGIASSKDLINWKDEGATRLEYTLTTPPESPFVVKHKGSYYLFYTNYKHGIVYIKSNDPMNWKENPDDPQSIIGGVTASEIFQENNTWYISVISHMKNGLHFFEIKELVWNKDGSVKVKDID